MKTKLIYSIVFGAFILALTQCNQSKVEKGQDQTIITQDSLIKKGQYLVTTLGCNDCHSPKRMGAHGPELIPSCCFLVFHLPINCLRSPMMRLRAVGPYFIQIIQLQLDLGAYLLQAILRQMRRA